MSQFPNKTYPLSTVKTNGKKRSKKTTPCLKNKLMTSLKTLLRKLKPKSRKILEIIWSRAKKKEKPCARIKKSLGI